MKQRYSTYKSSGVEWIGEIPSHWKTSLYKHHITILSGYPFKSELFDNEEGFPLMRIRDITSGKVETFYKGHFEENYVIKSGDIVIGMDGEFNVRQWDNIDILLNQRCCKIQDVEGFNRRFIFYTIPFDLKIINDLTYYTTVKHLSVDDINNIHCVIPPIEEQEQIVKYLDEKTSQVDRLISITEKKIEILKQKRTSLINEVVTKGLNKDVELKDSGVEWIGEIPRNWDLRKGSTIGNYSKGNGIKKDEVKELGFPCIRYGEIYTTYNVKFKETISFIDETTTKQSVKIKRGTLLLTGSGETLEDIGKCVVYMGDSEIYIGGDIIILTPQEDVNPEFLSYQINSECIRVQRELSGKGGIIIHIYSKSFRDMRFPLPPISEQEQIVKYIDTHTTEIDTLVSIEKRRIETLKEYRQSLISEVVTGKVRVCEEVL